MCRQFEADKITVHFEGKAIDVQDWTRYHPGGAKILKIFHERDCTAQCYATHSKQAMSMMRARANKSRREVPGPSKLDLEYLEMRDRYEKMGYFNVDNWVILENVLKNLAVLVPFFLRLLSRIFEYKSLAFGCSRSVGYVLCGLGWPRL